MSTQVELSSILRGPPRQTSGDLPTLESAVTYLALAEWLRFETAKRQQASSPIGHDAHCRFARSKSCPRFSGTRGIAGDLERIGLCGFDGSLLLRTCPPGGRNRCGPLKLGSGLSQRGRLLKQRLVPGLGVLLRSRLATFLH